MNIDLLSFIFGVVIGLWLEGFIILIGFIIFIVWGWFRGK